MGLEIGNTYRNLNFENMMEESDIWGLIILCYVEELLHSQ